MSTGWMEFMLCPTNDFGTEATEECFRQNPVQLAPRHRNSPVTRDINNILVYIQLDCGELSVLSLSFESSRHEGNK